MPVTAGQLRDGARVPSSLTFAAEVRPAAHMVSSADDLMTVTTGVPAWRRIFLSSLCAG
jgi:hypothetical protein